MPSETIPLAGSATVHVTRGFHYYWITLRPYIIIFLILLIAILIISEMNYGRWEG